MAYVTVIKCDLCDEIGEQRDNKFIRISCGEQFNSSSHEFLIDGAILCRVCADPIRELASKIKSETQQSRDKSLEKRVIEALQVKVVP